MRTMRVDVEPAEIDRMIHAYKLSKPGDYEQENV